jgi:hypothetical protein
VVVLWLSRWNREGPRARSRHEQQVGLAWFVPEDALLLGAGSATLIEDIEGGKNFGAAVAAVDAQGHRQGPGQRVEEVARRRSGSSRWSRPAPRTP